MPHRRIPFITNYHYHLFNRGVAKQKIFFDREDYEHFLNYMDLYSKIRANRKEAVVITIECYCLMPNHFHLLVKQHVEKGIEKYLRRFLTAYSMYFNHKYQRVGPLYQGRTQGKIVDNIPSIKRVSRYIHRNPQKLFVKEGINSFLKYEFSSLPSYLSGKKNFSFLLALFDNSAEKYKSFVLGPS